MNVPLSISKDKDILLVGKDVPIQSLRICSMIVWRNRGEYRTISIEHVKNMLQHIDNIYKHPKHHKGTKAALEFYWEQGVPLIDNTLKF